MAKRRMFSADLICSDRFIDLSMAAQILYLQLNMHADDDGFQGSARSIARMCGCPDSALEELVQKGYILCFADGVVVITDWLVNNAVRKDRYTPTIYADHKNALSVVNDRYVLCSPVTTEQTPGNHPVTGLPEKSETPETQVRSGKDSSVKDRQGKSEPGNKTSQGAHTEFLPPGVEEVRQYCAAKGYKWDPQRFVDYYGAVGWKLGDTPVRDWYALARNWERKEQEYGKTAANTGLKNVPSWTVGTVL